MTKTTDRRRESRYEVISAQLIVVHIRRQHREQSLRGELLNLSRTGAKVLLPTSLRFSESVNLRVEIAGLEIGIELQAHVCWVRPSGGDKWVAGCAFSRPISEAVFDRLGTGGIIERRRHPRIPANIQASARWELDTETVPVEVRDYSPGGFCLASLRPSTIGAAVLIELDALADQPPSSVCGVVCWQAQRDDRYLIGCMTRNANAAELLRKANNRLGVDVGARHALAVRS